MSTKTKIGDLNKQPLLQLARAALAVAFDLANAGGSSNVDVDPAVKDVAILAAKKMSKRPKLPPVRERICQAILEPGLVTCVDKDCGREHPSPCTAEACRPQRKADCNDWHIKGSYDRHVNLLKVQAAEKRKAKLAEEADARSASSNGRGKGNGNGKGGNKGAGNGPTTRKVTDHPGRSKNGSANSGKKTSSLGLKTLRTLDSLMSTPTTTSAPSQTYPTTPTMMMTPSTTPWSQVAAPAPSPSCTPLQPPMVPSTTLDLTVSMLAESIKALVADVRSMQGEVKALRARR